ncbi:MAG: PatB family C-S lyase [Akkermansia sp.]
MYNFDEVIDRTHTNSMNMEGFRQYIFHADADMKFPYADDEFIRMWIADMEFAVPDVIINGIKRRLEQRIFGYTRLFGDSYYNAFAAWCKRRYDWGFEQQHLRLSNGIIPALFEMVDWICQPDEKVLFLTPSYAYFKYAAEFSDKAISCCDLVNTDGYYSIDWEDLEQKAADAKTTLFILCNPHNPSGRVWTQEELEGMARIIEQHQLWVISDEIHCDLLRQGKQHIPLGKVMPDYPRLITGMAPSKSFNLAGMMISNIIIRDDALRAQWDARHYDMQNPLSIAAAQSAYEEGEPWLTALCDYLDKNFALVGDYLNEHLPLARYQVSEATYLAWVDLSAYFTPDINLPEFFAYKAGVLLEGGNMFVQHSDGFIRLNLACPRATIEKGLRRLSEATLHADR